MRHPMLATAIALAVTAQALTPPAPTSYWHVSPPLNPSDTLYAGLPQLQLTAEALVYNGTKTGRTYAHHPALYSNNHRVFLQYSTSPIDEDSIGQESWLSTSTDGGRSWTAGVSILPTALLPNQTGNGAANYTFWCGRRIWQRAVHPVAWVPVSIAGKEERGHGENGGSKKGDEEEEEVLYAVSQTTLRYCWSDTAKGTKAAGRIARRVSPATGLPVGSPCWTSQNSYTDTVLFNQTVYGTEYGMKFCEHAAYIERYLEEPETTPAWGSWLYSTKLYAADATHDVQEPTHGVWFGDDGGSGGPGKASMKGANETGGDGYWQRFWRDISGSSITSSKIWVEQTGSKRGEDWYPKREEQYGNNIFETDIPDAGSKAHYGYISSISSSISRNTSSSIRYLIHNPLPSPDKYRQPLTITTSRGNDTAFTGIGVLRTNASTVIAPDTRGLKRLMLSYPTAVVIKWEGKDVLVVSYSENKENIWVSLVSVEDLL